MSLLSDCYLFITVSYGHLGDKPSEPQSTGQHESNEFVNNCSVSYCHCMLNCWHRNLHRPTCWKADAGIV